MRKQKRRRCLPTAWLTVVPSVRAPSAITSLLQSRNGLFYRVLLSLLLLNSSAISVFERLSFAVKYASLSKYLKKMLPSLIRRFCSRNLGIRGCLEESPPHKCVYVWRDTFRTALLQLPIKANLGTVDGQWQE